MKAIKKRKDFYESTKRAHADTQWAPKTSAKNIDEELLRRKILERAYFIWEEKGRPGNTALEDWFQAEKEMIIE